MSKKKKQLWDSKWMYMFDASQKLGQGGQGVVRQVTNISTGQIGALKTLTNFKSEERRKRMQIESVSLEVLSHDNICKLLDSDTKSEGQLYLVTEFIDGDTLKNSVENKKFSIEDVISFSIPLLDAINHAHLIGVYHRDIKPENIILRNNKSIDPVLIDFGISFNQEEGAFFFSIFDGQQLGNRFLNLPELHRGARDPRSDITQICGVILYALTGLYPVSLIDGSGNHPHQRNEFRELINSIPCNTKVKYRLLRIFDRAFKVKLDDRWQTASLLSSELRKVLMSDEPEVDPYSLDSVRKHLEDDPNHKTYQLTNVLHDEFMRHTRRVMTDICSELGGNNIAQVKQGGRSYDMNLGEFGSGFGVVLPSSEVYFHLKGNVIGEEVVIIMQDDETPISRLSASSPDWNSYRILLKKEYTIRLNKLTTN